MERRQMIRGCAFALLMAAAACAPTPPVQPPTPPPLPRTVGAAFAGTDTPVVSLEIDNGSLGACAFDRHLHVMCELPANAPAPFGAYLRLSFDGFRSVEYRFVLDDFAVARHQEIADVLTLEPAGPIVAPLKKLVVRGTEIEAIDGTRFVWRGATAFRLLDYVAEGNEAAALAILDWLHAEGFNVARVITTMPADGWMPLSPEDAQRSLPRAFELAASRGVYLELVGLTGTKSMGFDAMKQHVAAVSAICDASAACAAFELANENAHPSQWNKLSEQGIIDQLLAVVVRANGTPISAGSNCCGQSDETQIYKGGTYLTVHNDRSRDTWERTRHMRELQAVEADWRLPVIADEPIGFGPVASGSRSTNPHEACGQAAIGRVGGFGVTFHYEGGLQALPGTDPTTLAAARAFIQCSRIVPDSTRLVYRNAGMVAPLESPVKSFTNASRAYSGISDTDNIVLGLGTQGGYSYELRPGWREVAVLYDAPGIKITRIER